MKRVVGVMLSICCAAGVVPGGTMDIQRFVDTRIAKGETTITIPPGRYRVVPQSKSHLTFSGLSDVTIIADDVEMICTETLQAMTIQNCTNFTIRGLTIDYDPLPFTQGRIVKMSDDKMVHEIELFKGYPRADSAADLKYAIFDPDTRELRYGNYFGFTVEALASNRLRITKDAFEARKDGGEKVGDLIVVGAKSSKGGSPHAVFCDSSQGTVLENITLYASPSFGFYEAHCDGSTYRNCKIDRCPPEADYVQREPRLRSLNADAYHSKYAKKGPQLLGCIARWQGDDCVNICGAYHLVMKANGNTLRVLAKRDMNIEPGDLVELVTVDGQCIPDVTVVSVERQGSATSSEKEGLKNLKLLSRTYEFLNDAYEIKVDRKVRVPFGSVISSRNRMGAGFAVKDCTFGNNRSRGILIKASDGEITGNRIENCASQAIKIAPEYNWLESGCSCNLTVADNTIINPGEEAIQIHSFGDYPQHKNIEITGNKIRSNADPLIYIGGLDGGRVQGNSVERMDGSPVRDPVVLEHCKRVTVEKYKE